MYNLMKTFTLSAEADAFDIGPTLFQEILEKL